MQKDKTELEVTRMTKENIQYLDVFFAVCKRYKVDYYHATEKQRAFIDAVAAHEFSMKQAHEKGLNRSSVPRLWASNAANAVTTAPHKIKLLEWISSAQPCAGLFYYRKGDETDWRITKIFYGRHIRRLPM